MAASGPTPPLQAPNLPWGAGCEPAVDPAFRTAANCGASLVDGDAVPPPNAPSLVEACPGRWITIYANDEHVFMAVAGLRFDTRDDPQGISGPCWKMAAPAASILPLFSVRHPVGL